MQILEFNNILKFKTLSKQERHLTTYLEEGRDHLTDKLNCEKHLQLT